MAPTPAPRPQKMVREIQKTPTTQHPPPRKVKLTTNIPSKSSPDRGGFFCGLNLASARSPNHTEPSGNALPTQPTQQKPPRLAPGGFECCSGRLRFSAKTGSPNHAEGTQCGRPWFSAPCKGLQSTGHRQPASRNRQQSSSYLCRRPVRTYRWLDLY